MKCFKTMMLVLALMAGVSAQADNFAYLTISQDQGSTSYEVSKINKITFDESNMIVHLSDGTTQQLPLSGLSKMFFSGSNASGIAQLSADGAQISMEDGMMRVRGLEGSRITIYNMGGVAVKNLTITKGEAEISLSGMRKGVYIVKVGSQSKKIMNK